MPKFEVLATQLIYLSTIVEADSEEEAQKIAIDRAEWRDYEAERVTYSDTLKIEDGL
jgi:hypothetical protein